MSLEIFNKIQQLLTESNADFRVVTHPAEGKSEEIAKIRGTTPHQGAKAMLVKNKLDGSFILAVLPGDCRLDYQALANHLGGKIKKKDLTLANTNEISIKTDCVVGCVPPFSFNDTVRLVVDPSLLNDNTHIAFNAGLLDRSIVLSSADYARIVHPTLVSISEPAPASKVITLPTVAPEPAQCSTAPSQ